MQERRHKSNGVYWWGCFGRGELNGWNMLKESHNTAGFAVDP